MPTGRGKYIIHATLSPPEAPHTQRKTHADKLGSQHVSKIAICAKGLPRVPPVCVRVLTSVYFVNVRVKSGHLS